MTLAIPSPHNHNMHKMKIEDLNESLTFNVRQCRIALLAIAAKEPSTIAQLGNGNAVRIFSAPEPGGYDWSSESLGALRAIMRPALAGTETPLPQRSPASSK